MKQPAVADRWVARPLQRPDAQLRLFCFPSAGGGVSAFRGWWSDLSPSIEVCPLQLPGREGRMRESPFTRIAPLIDALAGAVSLHLDLPFSFFGHSVGGLLAFELARELRRRGWGDPVRLVVSATAAPPRGMPELLRRQVSGGDLLRLLGSLGGTPPEILEHPEVMRLLLPAVQADLCIYQAYSFDVEAPLSCSITAMHGTADPLVAREDMIGWKDQTSGEFDLVSVPGGHFFLHEARHATLRVLESMLLMHARAAS